MYPCTSGDLITASAVVSANPGRLRGVQALADGTNAATIIIYDNATAASGRILAKIIVDATLTEAGAAIPSGGVVALNGLYASMSGTGAACIVYFDQG